MGSQKGDIFLTLTKLILQCQKHISARGWGGGDIYGTYLWSLWWHPRIVFWRSLSLLYKQEWRNFCREWASG